MRDLFKTKKTKKLNSVFCLVPVQTGGLITTEEKKPDEIQVQSK